MYAQDVVAQASTPVVSFKSTYNTMIKKGNPDVILTVDRYGNTVSVTNSNGFIQSTINTDGSFTIGTDAFSSGFDAHGNILANYYLPWVNDSSLGLTISLDRRMANGLAQAASVLFFRRVISPPIPVFAP